MEPFQRLQAVAVPIAQPNVDTDRIIPSRFLQKPRSTDFGPLLFRDSRFRSDGTEDPVFMLNQASYRPARILAAERNFGCGSSREHAVWALFDYGIRVVIAPSFGDIFRSNSLKNGLLPVILPEPVVALIIAHLLAYPGTSITVDLVQQEVTAPDGSIHRFDIEPFLKRCLIEGLDELAYTLAQMDRIIAFEQRHGAEIA